MSELDFREVPAGSVLDEFHFEMWVGMLLFLIDKDEVREAFAKETGKAFITAPRDAFSTMIDEACGFCRDEHNAEVMADFARWATDAYWGDETMICPAIAAKLATPTTQETRDA